MNYNFLPFAIGMALASTAANAETFEELTVEGETNLKGDVRVNENLKVWGEANLSTLNIDVPYTTDKSGQKTRTYDYMIYGSDATTNSYRKMFTVDWNGNVSAKGLTLREGTAIDTPFSSTLRMYFDKESNSFVFNTSGYEDSPYERHNTLTFDAGKYIFDRGEMIVNNKITCKDELNVVALNAKDINVEMNNAADYVFDESYDLKSLSEVESYVNEHKHLPGIPSAADMAEKGMSVAAMSNMLLEKVEELTLHMIRLEKENAALKAEVKSLKK